MKEIPKGRVIAVVVALLMLLTASKSFFIVRPDQFVVVTKFGDPVDEKRSPGIYPLIPFIEDPRYLDSRVRGWDDVAKNTNTAELKPIDFTAFARWEIDPVEGGPTRFYTAVGDDRRAHANMDSIVTKRIQAAVREHRLASIVRDRGRSFDARASSDLEALFVDYRECKPKQNKEIRTMLMEYETNAKERAESGTQDAGALRSEIVAHILQSSNTILKSDFGIQILDLHFKYLNYSPQVHAQITTKITKDRARDIARYNKLGNVCTGKIRQVKEEQLGSIIGERDRTVRELEGDGVAEAIRIKAEAFNSNPGFFRFLKLLEIYDEGLASNTEFVLSTANPILALMQDARLLETATKLPGLSERKNSREKKAKAAPAREKKAKAAPAREKKAKAARGDEKKAKAARGDEK